MNIQKTIVDQLKQVIDPIIAVVSEVRKDFEDYKKELPETIKSDPEFINLLKGHKGEKGDNGIDGKNGKDAEFDPELVANVIKQDSKFLMLSKGEKGDTGAQGEKGDKGIDGKDAVYDPLSTIVALKLDKEFVQIIKGDAGEKGEKGQNGKDGSNGIDGKNGKDARELKPIEVAEAVLSDKDFIERTTVKDGKDGLGIYTKTWTPGVYRQDEYVQHYLGQHFRAIVDTGEEPGVGKEWERVGTAGWRLRGFYKSDMPLEEGDLVTKDYGVFSFTNGELKLFIGRGAQGLKGDQGQKGEKGIDGINGKDGETIEIFEVGGTTIALVTIDADGNKHAHSVDLSVMFEPILKKVSAIHKSVQTVAKANELDYMSVKADIKQELLGHETEESAVPIRFFRGDWSSNSTYYPGDLVEFGNGLALCTAQTTGEVPDSMFSNSQAWEMLGGKGSGGDGTVSLAQDTSIQQVSFAAVSSPVDLSDGTIVNIGLITGNLVIPAPINPMQGKEYTFILPIDAVGGRTVTFPDGVALTGLLANRIYSVKFMYVGTDFIKISSTA